MVMEQPVKCGLVWQQLYSFLGFFSHSWVYGYQLAQFSSSSSSSYPRYFLDYHFLPLKAHRTEHPELKVLKQEEAGREEELLDCDKPDFQALTLPKWIGLVCTRVDTFDWWKLGSIRGSTRKTGSLPFDFWIRMWSIPSLNRADWNGMSRAHWLYKDTEGRASTSTSSLYGEETFLRTFAISHPCHLLYHRAAMFWWNYIRHKKLERNSSSYD